MRRIFAASQAFTSTFLQKYITTGIGLVRNEIGQPLPFAGTVKPPWRTTP